MSSRRPTVGYYVHHHGSGHRSRAAAVIAQLDADVTVLTSGGYRGPGDLLALPLDGGDETADPTAGGVLHWAPLHSSGLRTRMAMITDWIATANPDVFVVDVSVEVTMLARLLGVPTVVFAMPGDRGDAVHQLAYRSASRIIAPWPRELNEPSWLREHTTRTAYVGGISRFDGRQPAPPAADGRRTVVLLGGTGGAGTGRRQVDEAAAHTPGWRWLPVGTAGAPWMADPWQALQEADVVVSAAGQSSVADLAILGRPAIVIAEPRPFAEQEATGRALEAAGLATVLPGWPDAEQWPGLLESATASRWHRWQSAGAAARAARAIEQTARLGAATWLEPDAGLGSPPHLDPEARTGAPRSADARPADADQTTQDGGPTSRSGGDER